MVKPVRGPDPLAKGLHLGCGALLGLVLVGPSAYLLGGAMIGTWASTAAGVVLFAWLGFRYGDRFWDWFTDWWSRWWPLWP
jgi:hypothetical protein